MLLVILLTKCTAVRFGHIGRFHRNLAFCDIEVICCLHTWYINFMVNEASVL